MEEEKFIIKLKCYECENTNCSLYPRGTYVGDEESLQGCSRSVSEEDYAKYQHYEQEIWPFAHTNTSYSRQMDIYKKIIDFLYHIYNQPVLHTYNSKGKINIHQ